MNVRLLLLSASPPALAESVLAALAPPFRAGGIDLFRLDLSPFRSPYGQIDASCVLLRVPLPPAGWSHVALTDVDLYLPALTHVFGLAALAERRAVVSWARLKPEREGEIDVLQRRLLVEVVHELGHGLGLVHCPVPGCAMQRSAWPEALDLKNPAYCPACARVALAAVGG